jgi:hypothetical protein
MKQITYYTTLVRRITSFAATASLINIIVKIPWSVLSCCIIYTPVPSGSHQLSLYKLLYVFQGFAPTVWIFPTWPWRFREEACSVLIEKRFFSTYIYVMVHTETWKIMKFYKISHYQNFSIHLILRSTLFGTIFPDTFSRFVWETRFIV